MPALNIGCTSKWLLACVLLVLPWLDPFAPGPSPEVMPWLVTLTCLVLLMLWFTPCQIGNPGIVVMAWLVAASISCVMGLLQYFGVSEQFDPWVITTNIGEAFANLRQRNQFATLTNIGLVSLLWLVMQSAGRQSRPALNEVVQLFVAALMACGNAASSSRTGMVELLVLVALVGFWGCWRVRQIRRVLLVALTFYGGALFILPALAGWAPFGHGLLERLRNEDVTCGSRITLWSNVLHLISLRPWQGWGWGELDYAHFLTLYEGPRFCEILGNAHNLPLHLAVELGVPVALLVCGVVTWLIWRVRPWRETNPTCQMGWAVLMLLLLHSMLEYPLWYGPFQMALVLSLSLLWCRPDVAFKRSHRVNGVRLQQGFAIVLLAGLAYAAWDYHRISQIYLPMEQRSAAYRDNTLETIQDSWLFRDQVRFAQLTLTPLTPQNASQLNAMAHELLHFSPEARVVEKLIDSALLLGRDDEAQAFMRRYQAAYPQAYAQWVKARAE